MPLGNGRSLRLVLLGLGVLPLLGSGCLSISPSSSLKPLEESLVFQPKRFPHGEWQPEDLKFEDAWFKSEDGLKLHGWFCTPDQPQAVILYCHGNAGNVTSRYWKLRFLTEKLNTAVMCFDYRGYGRSDGVPSEEGLLLDAVAARRWLAKRTGVQEKDIVVLGESLGGAVAVDQAVRHGARGLILENTFTSIPDVAASKLPVRSLMNIQFNSLGKIGQYRGPLLQTHGTADRVVPLALGQKLFEAANEPKRFVQVSGGGHNGPPSREYVLALHRFLQTLPPVEKTAP